MSTLLTTATAARKMGPTTSGSIRPSLPRGRDWSLLCPLHHRREDVGAVLDAGGAFAEDPLRPRRHAVVVVVACDDGVVPLAVGWQEYDAVLRDQLERLALYVG